MFSITLPRRWAGLAATFVLTAALAILAFSGAPAHAATSTTPPPPPSLATSTLRAALRARRPTAPPGRCSRPITGRSTRSSAPQTRPTSTSAWNRPAGWSTWRPRTRSVPAHRAPSPSSTTRAQTPTTCRSPRGLPARVAVATRAPAPAGWTSAPPPRRCRSISAASRRTGSTSTSSVSATGTTPPVICPPAPSPTGCTRSPPPISPATSAATTSARARPTTPTTATPR